MTEQRCGKVVQQRERYGILEDWGPWSPGFLMQTVELIERSAEGEDLDKELRKASSDAHWLYEVRRDFYGSRDNEDPIDHELMATCEAARAVSAACYSDDPFSVAAGAARAVYRASSESEAAEEAADPAETAAQRDLVRDVFGRPLRLTAADPSWLTPTVTRLAHAIYDARAFDEMPILGDALEDAGCSDADVLSHLRAPKPHVRGCWVLHLLTARHA
jgi:hypothetical protein